MELRHRLQGWLRQHPELWYEVDLVDLRGVWRALLLDKIIKEPFPMGLVQEIMGLISDLQVDAELAENSGKISG